ncbi:unnamed protein product, partial [Mesorhabditis spiculigera]
MDFPEEGDGCAKFVLQASNFKVFHKAINAIAKISTTLSVEPTKQGSLLVAFKSANFTEKTHIQVDMRIHPEKDNFIMEMLLVNDVKRLYRVRVCDNKRQMPKKLSADKAKMANKLGCSPDTLLPIIEQMRNKSDELVVHAQRERIHFKNYQRDGAEKRTKLISEATWMSAQFNSMNIRRETEINFSAKEFKAILSFASQQGANVTLYFDQPSKGPSSVKMKSMSPKLPIIERGLSATPPPSRRHSMNVTANRVSAMRLNSSKSPAAEQSAFPCISPDWVPDNNDLAMETDFGAVNQPLDDDADRIPASPERPPPNKRDKKYRNFMMSTAHATQHASQRLTQQAWGHETMSRTKS